MPDACHGEQGNPQPLPVAVCPPFGLEHGPPGDSSSLSSPPLFFPVQRSPLVVSVFLRCSPASGVPLGSLVLVSALLGVVVYDTVLYCFQPRPELTRARVRGCRCSFPFLCPLWGCWWRFSLGVGVGALLRQQKSVAGCFCPFSIFPGALSKIYTGIKIAPLGRFWFRPGGAGLGFFGCLFVAGGWVRW